ncbi:MAG: hypothetical protein ACERKZ_00250 [Lachnotalea sp.]
MVVDSTFLGTICLLGFVIVVGILIVVILINSKLNKLIQETSKVSTNKCITSLEMKNHVDIQKSASRIGIVFCRNCASQFMSDKDACPVCGEKRH